MKRSEARELAMQLIFQMEAQNDFTKNAQITFMQSFANTLEPDEYIEKLIDIFVQNKIEIDKQIEDASNKWHINRLAKVDLAILRLAITELKYLNDSEIPTQVSINEAVKLAKKFGSDDSAKFINGILGNIVRA